MVLSWFSKVKSSCQLNLSIVASGKQIGDSIHAGTYGETPRYVNQSERRLGSNGMPSAGSLPLCPCQRFRPSWNGRLTGLRVPTLITQAAVSNGVSGSAVKQTARENDK